jgi:parallel beta-helix repeat protein
MANRVLFNGGVGVTISGSGRNEVIGNEIRANAAQGIALIGGQNNRIGVAGAGNAIVSNGLNGIVASGNLRGSSVVANTIVASGTNGLRVQAATNLLVGGTLDGVANTIVTSTGNGLLATGACGGTRVIRNVIADNTGGDVNVAAATGIIYVP